MAKEEHPIDTKSLFDIRGKTALITGGSRGIGLMIAQGYVESGVQVFISSRKADVCDAVADELSKLGSCVSIPADVATSEGRAHLVSELKKQTDALNILVNNAGTNWGAPYDEYPDDGFRKVMELNVNAVFSLTRDLTPLLEKGGTFDDPARIVNIGSMDGIKVPTVARTGTFAYSASKAALHHLTRSLAVELAPRNITVNAVAPGFFESKMTERVLDQYKSDIENNALIKRIGRPAEMAGIAIYLASRAAAYTTGTTIPVDGGTSIN